MATTLISPEVARKSMYLSAQMMEPVRKPRRASFATSLSGICAKRKRCTKFLPRPISRISEPTSGGRNQMMGKKYRARV